MGRNLRQEREWAVTKYRIGERPEAICATLGCSHAWLYKWVKRFNADDPAWSLEQPRKPHTQAQRTPAEIEEIVKMVRLNLYNQDVFSGAQAIHWEPGDMGVTPLPSIRTINRILVRNDLTHRRTGRYISKHRAYPYLTAQAPNQVHQADFIGPFYLKRQAQCFYSLDNVDIATGRSAVEPISSRSSQTVVDALWAMWWRLGIPRYMQVDNEMVFGGSPRYPRTMSAFIRFCLLHDIEPWFIPIKEPWRNGVVEKFNDHFQGKFLGKVTLADMTDLRARALLFEDKHNRCYRYSKLQGRTPLIALRESKARLTYPSTEQAPQAPFAKPQQGRYHLVRLIRSDLVLNIFGERFPVSSDLMFEYVVATIDVKEQKLKLYHDTIQVEEYEYTLN
jgi:transposase InsO family protein